MAFQAFAAHCPGGSPGRARPLVSLRGMARLLIQDRLPETLFASDLGPLDRILKFLQCPAGGDTLNPARAWVPAVIMDKVSSVWKDCRVPKHHVPGGADHCVSYTTVPLQLLGVSESCGWPGPQVIGCMSLPLEFLPQLHLTLG
jgi:hypothetical protein